MIGGFIITGNAPKPVILRGLGASLVSAGIAANLLLADPVLELHGASGLIDQNDDWKDSPQRSQFEGTPFQPTDDHESVIVATLSPGAYTLILSGKNQTAGIGLVEIYDTNQLINSQLANISTRAFVQTLDNVVIAGFVLGNNVNASRVAVRGLGPSLANFGVTNVLADPTLAMHNANGTVMIANDNWIDDPVSAAQLFVNGLTPPNASESGIFVSLPPGQYTVILAGKNSGVGVGLVEVYNLR
jgi:hypothetical protein